MMTDTGPVERLAQNPYLHNSEVFLLALLDAKSVENPARDGGEWSKNNSPNTGKKHIEDSSAPTSKISLLPLREM